MSLEVLSNLNDSMILSFFFKAERNETAITLWEMHESVQLQFPEVGLSLYLYQWKKRNIHSFTNLTGKNYE